MLVFRGLGAPKLMVPAPTSPPPKKSLYDLLRASGSGRSAAYFNEGSTSGGGGASNGFFNELPAPPPVPTPTPPAPIVSDPGIVITPPTNMQTCWDGSQVQASAMCPPEPMPTVQTSGTNVTVSPTVTPTVAAITGFAFSDIPTWAWLLGGGGLLVGITALVTRARRNAAA